MTSCHIRCACQSNLQLLEDGKNELPKHVAALYNKHKHCATSSTPNVHHNFYSHATHQVVAGFSLHSLAFGAG